MCSDKEDENEKLANNNEMIVVYPDGKYYNFFFFQP